MARLPARFAKCAECGEHKEVQANGNYYRKTCHDCNNFKQQCRTYGITPEEFHALYDAQGGCCAICETAPPTHGSYRRTGLVVDHCHGTNKVRGLLCSNCNLVLGHARDDAGVLARAQEYLNGRS